MVCLDVVSSYEVFDPVLTQNRLRLVRATSCNDGNCKLLDLLWPIGVAEQSSRKY
jgi:hypothetical protein